MVNAMTLETFLTLLAIIVIVTAVSTLAACVFSPRSTPPLDVMQPRWDAQRPRFPVDHFEVKPDPDGKPRFPVTEQ